MRSSQKSASASSQICSDLQYSGYMLAFLYIIAVVKSSPRWVVPALTHLRAQCFNVCSFMEVHSLKPVIHMKAQMSLLAVHRMEGNLSQALFTLQLFTGHLQGKGTIS